MLYLLSLYELLCVYCKGEYCFVVCGMFGDCVVIVVSYLMKGVWFDVVLFGVNCGVNFGIEMVFFGMVGVVMMSMLVGVLVIVLS